MKSFSSLSPVVRAAAVCAVVVVAGASAARAQGQSPLDLRGLRPVENPTVITLDDAYARAAQNSIDLRLAKLRVEESQARVRQAWSAVLPNLSVGGDYTFNYPEISASFVDPAQLEQQALLFNSIADITEQSSQLNPDPVARTAALEQAEELRKAARDIRNTPASEIVIQPAHVVQGALTLSMPIFSGRSIPLLQNAYAGVDVQRLITRQARTQVLFAVARTYYQVVAAKRILVIAEGQVDSATKHLQVAKAQAELGALSALQLQRAGVELSRAKQQLRAAKGGLQVAKGALGGLISMEDDFDVAEPPALAPLEESISVDELVVRALEQRPDIKLQKESLAIADRSRVDAWMRLLPSVNLQMQGRYTSNVQGFVNQPFTGAVIVQAQLPLYDGGFTYGAIDEANAKVRQELLRVRQVEQAIGQQVRGNLEEIEIRRESVLAAEETAALAQAQKKNAEQLFELGAATNVDVLDANLAAFSADVEAARARFDLETARLGLAYATGGLNPAADAAPAPLEDDEEERARDFIEPAGTKVPE